MGVRKSLHWPVLYRDNLKEPMTKIIVTETYLRVYELDVPDLEEETINRAIDTCEDDFEPEWAGTCVCDEQGDEILDF